MAIVDLHLHTRASDGRLSPRELVNYIYRRGIRYAAITDHDSTEALNEAYDAKEQFSELTLIPGIELSTEVQGGEIHILGYFLKWKNQEFQDILANFRQGRVYRAEGMVSKLDQIGIKLDWQRVLHFAGDGSVGRPHIALSMVEMGYVNSVKEAFDRYLGRDGPAYVGRAKLRPVDAIEMIQSVGGAAVLAHPSWVDNLETNLVPMKDAGLVGMEVHYGNYSPEMIGYLARVAATFDLIPCGGSDYHAMGNQDEALPGNAGPPESTVEQLRASAHNNNQSVM